MTNVHAFIHRVTPTELADPAVPRVELCIHGGGEKYARGLTVADDSLPAVQRLKQMLAECCGDDDRSDDDNSDSSNDAYVTADSQNVASQLVISEGADNVLSGAPAVDVVDVRELSSGCLKRSSRGRESAAKKQKIDADDASERTNAEHSSDTEEDSSDRAKHSSDTVEDSSDRSVVSSDRAVVSSDRAVVSSDTPVVSSDRPVVSSDRAVVSSDRPVVFSDRPVVSSDRAVVSSDRSVVSSDRAVVSSDRADTGCDERGGGNEVAVVNRSSAADGSQSAESSAADSGGDRCLLNTSTGKLQL